ncbi:MAG: ribose-phosphate pyrophosphokinase-like domain-containing protein, partial [Kiritimatiellae bacterium]|nr:ribose-phosphate pyrophosphokinase-like domain-containing protein [Kiritimatiellia bacterium]
MKIFTGNANPVLAEKISEHLKQDLGQIEIKRFPDGEIFVQVKENIRGRDVFIVQSICCSPNDALMELLIMIDAMRRASAARITAVLPFYGYARQDRK